MGKMTLKVLFVVATLCFANGVADAGGKAYWQENGVCICERTRAGELDIVSDSSGGAIVAWGDNRGGYYRICVQRVDSAGAALWDTNGVVLWTDGTMANLSPMVVSDGKNGAIVVWDCEKLYAVRVDSDGVKKWQTIARQVPTHNMIQYPSIVSDGSGGVIVGWIETYFTGMNQDSMFLRVQRVDGEGAIRWGNDGTSISRDHVLNSWPSMASDEKSGVIIAWTDYRRGDWDIYAQRVDSCGIIRWDTGGIVICSVDSIQSVSSIVVSSQRAIIAWGDKRSGDFDGYAQALTLEGAMRWDSNGVAICVADNNQCGGEALFVDDAGQSVLWWADNRFSEDYDLYAQKVDANGTIQWNDNGIRVTTLSPSSEDVVAYGGVCDERKGVILTWKDYRAGNWDIYAQRVDSSGALRWGDNALAVAVNPDYDGCPVVATDGKGGAIIAWATNKGAQGYVYVQRINDDTTGVQEKVVIQAQGGVLTAQPNPFLERTTIRYSVPRKVRVSLKVFDVTGRCVETLVNGERKPGYHETELGTRKLGPGVYFAKFEAHPIDGGQAREYRQVRKLILMR
jgi:hypothetical protein